MLRMFPLSAAIMVALLSTGCVSTSNNDTATSSAMVNAETARPQTLFAARLQPVAGVTAAELADNRIKVSFPGTTAFSHDGAGISDELQGQLGAVAEALKGINYQNVTVFGYTDSSGQLAYNNKLSQQRARQVVAFLQQHGLAAEQLAAEGRGPTDPIADNKTAQGRAANRRVEIEVVF